MSGRLVQRDVEGAIGEASHVERETSRQTAKPNRQDGKPTKHRRQQTVNTLKHVRSAAISKANRLQGCHRHLEQLAPAFAEWSEGEIYVCKKTGTYRYRFGDRSKSVTSWDAIARKLFATPADFAFAAAVLGGTPQLQAGPAPLALPDGDKTAAVKTGRVNIIALADVA